jgi:xanthine dehydrogenase YagT iron-sulfur-binding subunit
MPDVKVTRRALFEGGVAGLAATALPAAQAAARDAPSFAAALTTRFTINGAARSVVHDARVTLLDLLRESLALTGAKKGCN